jgi:hypothetical protein
MCNCKKTKVEEPIIEEKPKEDGEDVKTTSTDGTSE